MKLLLTAITLAAWIVPVSGVGAQVDPLIGTWAVNLATPTFEPGPPPQALTVTYPKTVEGYAWSSDGVDSQGRPTHSEGVIVFDGKYYPVTGNRNWDELAFHPIDAHTSEVTRKKDGKVVQTARRVPSHDGTTLTITTQGVDANGRRIREVVLYDKQPR